MMFKKNLSDLFISMFPLLLLFIGSGYLTYVTWNAYQESDFSSLTLLAGMTLLSLFSMAHVFYRYVKERHKDLLLRQVLDRITELSADVSQVDDLLIDIKQREDVYAYIDERFHALHEQGKKIQHEGKSKSEFLSTMSHEIRTPLNGIIGFTKLLKELATTEDQQEYVTLIENSSHNLIAIVNDILDLSKINAEKMVMEHTSFNLFKIIEFTVAPFAQQADQKDIELGLFVDPTLSANVIGDPTKLSQILTNLIGNAIKFTDAYGKINLYVQGIKREDDEIEIKFSVEDNGIGLTPEQQKSIFEAYGQASTSTSRKYGGTGLGLTISRKMVTLMGGDLEVESQKDIGTTFFFTLRLKKDKEQEVVTLPDFSSVSIGLALPTRSIERQLDKNLEAYIRHLGADFSIYCYDELFESHRALPLPDIMIFDHHYARLPGELEQCSLLACKSVLLTNGSLRSRINLQRHNFTDVILTPIGLTKAIRILNNAREEVSDDSIDTAIEEETKSFQGLHALAADDNIINCKLIKVILEQLGLEVTIAVNGKEAFEMYKENVYDIVFMDIQMPLMDGLEANRNILQYELEQGLEHVPIIALTANNAPEDKKKYLDEGMDDYATKPLDLDALEDIISKHCIV